MEPKITISIDAKTGKRTLKETPNEDLVTPIPKELDIVKAAKLVEYAEAQGWI